MVRWTSAMLAHWARREDNRTRYDIGDSGQIGEQITQVYRDCLIPRRQARRPT
jgi:hypothetical protein